MFESMLMQTDIVTSITALIIAVTGILGTVASLFLGVGNKLKVNSHDSRLVKLGDDFISVGQLGTAFAQKTSEHTDDLRTFASVLTTLSPEMRKALEEQGKGINYWTEKANISDQQLKRLLPMVDAKAQANRIEHLPRESQQTLAVTNKSVGPVEDLM